MVKEIWLRIGSEKAKEAQEFILSLADEDLLGEIPVVLCGSGTNGKLRLSHIYDVGESALLVLKEKYGDRNVREVTAEGNTGFQVLDQAQPVEQIADSLEEIASGIEDLNEALERISDFLERCENKGPWGFMLAISGTVETH